MAAQLLTMPEHSSGPALPLGERLKQLRRERGWSQADLATKVGADGGQISRYENGHMTPSAEAVVKLAEALDVSTDYLLIDASPRRSLHGPENALGDRITAVAELSDDELGVLRSVIDGLVAKSRLRALAGGSADPASVLVTVLAGSLRTMGFFGTFTYSDDKWNDGGPTKAPYLSIDIYDSDIATIRYRPAFEAVGHFFLGFEPRAYFDDAGAEIPVDTNAEAKGFAKWIKFVQKREVAPSRLKDLMAKEDGYEPTTDFVEEAVEQLLALAGVPIPHDLT